MSFRVRIAAFIVAATVLAGEIVAADQLPTLELEIQNISNSVIVRDRVQLSAGATVP